MAMTGILVDINVQGQSEILLRVWHSARWREVWQSLGLQILTLPPISLAANTSDVVLWFECQRRQVVLLTGNRNKDGADSLEQAIRDHNTETSLPVIPLANAQRIEH
jgi:hypothetical protein